MNRMLRPAEQLNHAQKLYENGQISQSSALLRRLLKSSPSYFPAAHLLSKIEFETKNYNLAKKHAYSAIREAKSTGAPDDTILALLRDYAYLLTYLGEFKSSIEICCSILKLKKDDEQARLFMITNMRSEGQYEEALIIADALLSGKNKDRRPEILCEKGEILIGLQNHEEAFKAFEQASELDIYFAHSYFGKAKIFFEKNDFKNALKNLDKAIEVHPLYTEAFVLRGSAMMGLECFRASLESFDKAIEVDFNYAPAHAGRSKLLARIGRLRDALISCDKAIALNQSVSEFHLLRFNILLSLNEKTQAESSLQRSMEVSNNNVDIFNEAAEIMIDTGDFSGATDFIRRGLQIDQYNCSLLSLLPKCQKMTIDDRKWFETVESLADEPIINYKQKITLHFALGKYLDDICSYDLAFMHYKKANDLQGHQQTESRYVNLFKEKRALQKKRFYPGVYEKLSTIPEGSPRLIFIVGMPRSGTSLVEQIITSHPNVIGVGEIDFAPERDLSLEDLSLKTFREIGESYLWNINAYSNEASYIVNKMPHNHNCLGFIHAIFPSARIIHCFRNPIDTCLSIYFQEFNRIHSYATDLNQLADEYRDYADIMGHWKKLLPQRVLMDLSYESLIDDQRTWTGKILEFIGLDWDDHCMQFYENNRAVKTPSRWQVRQGIYKTSKERWRNYEAHISPLLPLLETNQNCSPQL